uniref:Uncharacterized protein n=1 Tax=Anguilla anguilla TaxID=7936 RepID=A0A0E9VKI8_ANGAN
MALIAYVIYSGPLQHKLWFYKSLNV